MNSRELRIIAIFIAILVILSTLYFVVFSGNINSIPQLADGDTWDPNLGWDFEGHTYTHPYLTTLSADQIQFELEQVNAAFVANGYPTPKHTSYPYGDYNSLVETIVAQYRQSGTGILGGQNYYPVFNWYEIENLEIRRTTSWETLKGWVDSCIVYKTLLQIFTHDITSDETAYQYPFGCTPEMLTQLLDYLVEKQNAGQLTVMTMAQAYDYWSAAKQQPNATVVISFDDSHKTDYTQAYPLFKARGLKGTSYIQVNLVGQSDRISWDEIAEMRAGL